MLGFEHLFDGWHLLVLVLLGIFIFGPDRLPKAIADGVRMLRNLRNMARNATSDLNRELGTDFQLEDLNPKALLRKHLLSEEDEQALRRPLEQLYREVQDDVKGIRNEATSVAESVTSPSLPRSASPAGEPAATTPAATASAAATPPGQRRAAFDLDAT
jgi:sec-independent protein translocase protein TatB